MAYFPSFSFYLGKNISNILKRVSIHKYCSTTEEINFAQKNEGDLPVKMEKNPYETQKRKCILCKHNIEPNYKNVRLLSQFVSSYTGRVLPRHITGICLNKHKKLTQEIKKAKEAYLMPRTYKPAEFFEDPLLFDIQKLSKPRRVI